MTHASLTLAEGLRETRLTYLQLWTRYIGLGGSGSLPQLQNHVGSDDCPDDAEHNIIAQALNDTFVENGGDHPVAYRHLRPPHDLSTDG